MLGIARFKIPLLGILLKHPHQVRKNESFLLKSEYRYINIYLYLELYSSLGMKKKKKKNDLTHPPPPLPMQLGPPVHKPTHQLQKEESALNNDITNRRSILLRKFFFDNEPKRNV